ncbi:MAG: hypothetical protein MJE77_12080 [Proteobacteria bacterium]|nr:hypothetical protein [Pseudomonadota bacterium]
MKRKNSIFVVALLVGWAGLCPLSAEAEPTRITVRVIAKGAKFIGSSMGGVAIVVRDVDTDAILAQGVVRGSTGDTDVIMTAGKRGTPLSTPGAAAFTATLDLDEPRRVDIIAYGPRGQLQGAARASVTHWLVPGRHVTGGDGVVLELPGFIVDVLEPGAHTFVARSAGKVRIDASITMMCGCSIAPGGLWNADEFTIMAQVKRNGKLVREQAMKYAGRFNRFTTDVDARRPGTYHVLVYAYDGKNGNTGVDATTFVVK